MKVPSNIITTGKYTIGGEFINKNNYKPYQGYYYELNNKFFAGKEFNVNAPEIIKTSSVASKPLFNKVDTNLFDRISGFIPTLIKFSSFLYNNESSIRYFSKQNNISPTLIREVDKKTFEQFKLSPLYSAISLSYNTRTGFIDNEIKEAEKTIPGITEFLKDLNFNPDSDIDNYSLGRG